jgi:hypothetical protein
MVRDFKKRCHGTGSVVLAGATALAALAAAPGTAGGAERLYRDFADPPANGFMIESVVGGNISLNAGDPALLVVPTLRIGAMFKPLAVAVNLSYLSSATFSDGYSGRNVITGGIDVMPNVWRSLDDRARLYLLAGFNFGGVLDTNIRTSMGSGADTSQLAAGFSLGLGGRYFLHRNFALGAELGNRTQFVRPEGNLTAVSTLYGAFTATFVAGR